MTPPEALLPTCRLPAFRHPPPAGALGASAEYVAALLWGPMRPAARAYYRTSKSPKLPSKQMNFFDAVRADKEMSKEQRAYWLSLEQVEG